MTLSWGGAGMVPFHDAGPDGPADAGPCERPAEPFGTAGQTCLAAQTELADQRRVAAFILALEIVKQAAALGDESKQTTAGMVVLLVVLEVLGQVLDALGKNRHLDFRR